MDKRTAEKKERLLSALDKGLTMIHVDARRPGVIVPEHLRKEPHLLLSLSYRFDPPDLAVGEWGVRSTLTFSGSRFTVAIPWSALYAISSQVTKEFWMYPDDMPKELLEQARLTSKVPEGSDEALDRPRGILREVVAVKPKADPEEPQKPTTRGHLRVVK
ncbi:MAG: stringent starvation protein B [Myxococcales bacterium]|nr:stringent starvation protein B [Myxococcales bacterium]